ncbi:MAG: glycosyltransferase [Pirellulaceae bacterium]
MSDPKSYRILCCSSSMAGGGSERQLLQLLRGLDRQRFCLQLFLLYQSGELLEEVPDSIPITTWRGPFPGLPLPGRFHRDQVRAIRALVQGERIELVYERLFHMALLTGQALHGTRTARVTTIVSPPSQDVVKTERRWLAVKKRLLRQSYQQADRVLAVSASTAEDASRFYDLPRERFEVIPSPIDCQRIDRLLVSEDDAVHRWMTDRSMPQIVSVGRLSHEKGQRFLIEAIGRVEQLAGHKLMLHLVGDGPMRGELVELVSRMGLANRVLFHGFQANPYLWIRQADLLVLPSLYEGFPNVLMEAMYCQVPALVTDVSLDVRQMMAEVGGYAPVPGGSSEALAAGIIDRLESPSRWLAAAGRSRQRILDHHQLPQWLDRMADLFAATIQRRREG